MSTDVMVLSPTVDDDEHVIWWNFIRLFVTCFMMS